MVTTVTLAGGGQAILEDDPRFGGEGKALLRMETGRQVLIPRSALLQEGGRYRLPFTAEELAGGAFGTDVGEQTQVMSQPLTDSDDGTVTVPLMEETLNITKREVVTGGVRLIKKVTEREETVDLPLLRADVQVERVPIGRIVAEAPASRQEGDTLIVPIMEEVLVVEKRLMLKEEVRITRTQTEVHQPQAVTLRTEEAVIEGITPDAPAAPESRTNP